ncbi:hypothetical protein [Nitratifractor salsuginis]|uniref:Uncharacterized protein n=1 Tax=Nitratifractor salsuginis (strain DSM 16511 / JCM 12458 / E9I37-1) TaxID=749222 RepID=E6X1G7_NITSE|nr:hypothetical protein [Nitratifractor salsuginis]ADV45900.1 hypothetical protein Nitsa_0632 [Nitratifractor salsuginis DSM 16511]
MDMILDPRYLSLHIAIVLIAATLLYLLFREMRKPKKDPNEDPDTKRINDMLKD